MKMKRLAALLISLVLIFSLAPVSSVSGEDAVIEAERQAQISRLLDFSARLTDMKKTCDDLAVFLKDCV